GGDPLGRRGERLGDRVMHRYLMAGGGEAGGDPRAHQARADDGDGGLGHPQASPVSSRYSPLGSTIATSRTMQPSPLVQRQGNAAKVTRLPVTLSISPPTFSKPTIPLPSRWRWQGSQSGKSSAQSRPPVYSAYSSRIPSIS